MQFNKKNNNFVRYLKNETFIEWKLFQSLELHKYWNDYIRLNPEEKNNFELTEKHFDNIIISSKSKLSYIKKQEAIKRLEYSLKAYNCKLKIRLFTYVAAACVATMILSIIFIQTNINKSEDEIFTYKDFIVGSELETEDILFISGENSLSFQNNVEIQFFDNKTAQIKCEQKEQGVIPIKQDSMNKLIVPYGKRSKITLSDGTKIWLNSGSSLEFPSTFSENRREVLLLGEMYIEVAPDNTRLFYVHTSNYNVKVYGTKFNVSSYSESASSVVLVEGSVSLQSANNEELFLSPNKKAIFSDNGTFRIEDVDVVSLISWKDGYLTFNDTPVTVALNQIERYYNLSFNYEDEISFQKLTCTGKIILSDNLDNVLTTLSLISSTKYKREGELIYLYMK